MTAQVWLNTNLVRLQKAVLCANCEVISEGRNGHCACCGSQSLLTLSRVLGGTIEPELSFGFATSAHVVSDDIGVSLSTAPLSSDEVDFRRTHLTECHAAGIFQSISDCFLGGFNFVQ
jgi:hypothetical protein